MCYTAQHPNPFMFFFFQKAPYIEPMRTTLDSTLRTYAFIVLVSTFMCSFSYAFLCPYLSFDFHWDVGPFQLYRISFFFHVCLACCSGWHMFVFSFLICEAIQTQEFGGKSFDHHRTSCRRWAWMCDYEKQVHQRTTQSKKKKLK